ncbi:UvrD-like helicase C-terminal domain-containing protein [Pseudomonas sp. NFACC32-1]|uniref:UvrD-helicase domain-containing protein n=1 Tax=Pseudomonas sp. NFACC32-1 TaxID=1566198 RepID=UPI0008764BBB|nr:UvrD-helicase domain-containing protein [Pseudomonas sp. NFACC32-1]SCX70749.1 UvrD-like helicase C-terminal domain-containing protein [Pseudomonas sp. NFACC32-1]
MAQHSPDLPPELLPVAQMPLLKRLAARLFGHGLTRLRAQHRASWLHGQADGFRSGHTAGFDYGYQEGRAEGLEEGRQVLLIRDARSTEHPAPRVDDLLFDDWRLPLTAELKKRIKADVARLLPAHAQPSAAQWKMIFSDTPSTSVVAGAGAGKSTTLVLRIVLLSQYLGFELDSMTVVTFTRESRKDFIQKLIEVFALWGRTVSLKEARDLVRTFHSRILPMVRSLPGFERLQAFETLSHRAVAGDDDEGNPFDLRINDAQRQQLNACYHHLYQRDERFRELIGSLSRHALQLKALERDHPDVQKRVAVTELAAQRDEELCDAIEDLWFRAGAWPIKGIEPRRQTFQINGSTFHCHGYIASLDAWVMLGFDPQEDARLSRPGARLGIRAEWAVKRTLFQAFCRKPLIWIESYESSRRVLSALAGDASAGPGFDYKVKGELGAAPLLDCFVAAASFIENLGLDVPDAVGQMCFAQDDPDRYFFEALSRFWRAFEDHLLDQSPPVMTYNRMFALFSEHSPENFRLLGDEHLRPLSHLMIDEFQDVSPQIVSWLRACLREVRSRGAAMHVGRAAQRSSLLCVGDDWQSIYGWRGSSPSYFMAFTKQFPSPANTRVMLTDNYRSHQYIIDAAEHIVRAAAAIPGKKAKASGKPSVPSPVAVLDRDDEGMARKLEEHYRKGDSILMLYRKTSDKLLIEKHIQPIVNVDSSLPHPARRLRQMTYHSAKGLQADAVFLLGDCQHLSSSPYKNQVYRMAGLGQDGDAEPYDTAQKDEILRLAYVGITRAVQHCYWYVDGQEGQAANAPRASDRIGTGKAFFADQRRARGG